MRKVGAYLPGAHEEVVDIVAAFILTDKVTPPLAVIGSPLESMTPVTQILMPHLSSVSESAPRSRPEGLQGRRRAGTPDGGGVARHCGRQGISRPGGGGGGGGRGQRDHPDQQAVLRGPGPRWCRRETSAGQEAGGEGEDLLLRSPCPLGPGPPVFWDGSSSLLFVLLLLRQGECSFFLQPGEHLEDGIQDVYILSEEEGLVLRAVEAFHDVEEVRPGAEGQARVTPGLGSLKRLKHSEFLS